MDLSNNGVKESPNDWYRNAIEDISIHHRNHDQRLKEVEAVIIGLDRMIEQMVEETKYTKVYKSLRNQAYYLKYLILEST